MAKALQAILFDLDGTLLDTAADMGAALNAVLIEEGRDPVGPEVAQALASHGSRGLLEFAYGAEFYQRRAYLRERFLTHYSVAIVKHTQLYEGVAEVLAELRNCGLQTAIVTNKPAALTEQLMPYFPELDAIAVRVGGDTLAVAKPDPAPILHAAKALKVEPQKCWYVGDAERDIIAGRAAGMGTILARYGYFIESDEPHLWGADMEIHKPVELLQLLKDHQI